MIRFRKHMLARLDCLHKETGQKFLIGLQDATVQRSTLGAGYS